MELWDVRSQGSAEELPGRESSLAARTFAGTCNSHSRIQEED
jgi:hypothetical protein